jgi:hypothetical protein
LLGWLEDTEGGEFAHCLGAPDLHLSLAPVPDCMAASWPWDLFYPASQTVTHTHTLCHNAVVTTSGEGRHIEPPPRPAAAQPAPARGASAAGPSSTLTRPQAARPPPLGTHQLAPLAAPPSQPSPSHAPSALNPRARDAGHEAALSAQLFEALALQGDDLDEDQACIFCMQFQRDAICIPCGHMVLCHICCDKMMGAASGCECPVCRSPVSSSVTVTL